MKLLIKTWVSRILMLVVTCILAGALTQGVRAQGSTEGAGSGTSTTDTVTGSESPDTGSTSGASEMAEGTSSTGTTTTETETDTVVGTTTTSDNGSGTNTGATGATDTGNQPLLWVLGAAVLLGIGALLMRRRPPADTNSHTNTTP